MAKSILSSYSEKQNRKLVVNKIVISMMNEFKPELILINAGQKVAKIINKSVREIQFKSS